MKLFHYHWWTPELEDMEKFYEKLGFEVILRLGKLDGELKTCNPPLTWESFRDKNILFRLIELRKGQTNITFGYGKRNVFDHIGFLINQTEYALICEQSKKLNWKLEKNEKRTFIVTPWKFRIELQTNLDYLTPDQDVIIKDFTIEVPFRIKPIAIAELLNVEVSRDDSNQTVISDGNWALTFVNKEMLDLESIAFQSQLSGNYIDPMGTKLVFKENKSDF